jgi:acetylornithine deacetylase/succinyl-diaminopimelate desuccinylase-like protein
VRNRLGDDGYQLDILHALDPVETDPTAHPVTILKEVLGEEARVISVPYATEMVMLKPSNPIVMVCGPGDPQGCHIVDEKIELAQVVKAVEAYTEFCSRVSGG